MKRVLITGASSGIGLELAKRYLMLGNEVIACGRDMEKMRQVFSDVEHDQQLMLSVFDVDQLPSTLATMSKHQDLDLVILNAGTCEYIEDPVAFDSELFARVIHTNVIGIGHCLQAVTPQIKTGGQLAIVSSTVTFLPLPRSEAYGASKAALDYLTRTLSIDLARHQIDVCLVRPGFVDTPLTRKNDFPMPGIISSDEACKAIINGLSKRRRNIIFPRRFHWCMRGLSLLPESWWRCIAIKMVK